MATLSIIKSILIVVSTILFANYTAEIDYQHLLKKQYFKNHNSRFRQRFMVGVLIALFNPFIALGFGLFFWALFDFILNYKRGLDLYYVGLDSMTDSWFSKKPIFLRLSKYISLIIGLTLIFTGGILINTILNKL